MSVRAWAPVAVVFEPQARRCSDWRCSASSSAPPASLSDLWTQACLPPPRVSVRSVDSSLSAAVAGFLPSSPLETPARFATCESSDL
ncbi:hypothetical protein GN244_ATG14906 [Phytophthora infestans]|uniref:Uncharacterized protein n=1 Tax=Phytophthora infestans TaxID=4787 RepID=A0A833SWT4_PHYIN|nr:hypothetical protein GN244_ATG14906 [Phytophthora infestans]KAF4137706.1 hypothetical protein GN958_ATG13107 [Phytophthora infestans]